jgi:hypothetical protein
VSAHSAQGEDNGRRIKPTDFGIKNISLCARMIFMPIDAIK